MYSRNTRRNSRRRPASRATRLTLIAAGACIPVIAIGYVVTAHGGRTVDTANAAHHTHEGAGGWGRGGYMMMPGPAGWTPADAQDTTPAGGQSATPLPTTALPSIPQSTSPQATVPQATVPATPTATSTAATPTATPTATSTANAAAMSSANWSGYAAAGTPGTFTNVSASWTQPTVTCGATNTFSSFWVGLDGDGTNSVEQTGTEADCSNGAGAYSGWWEMFPNAPVFYQNPVAPGDAMSASVVANGGGSFTLTLTDATQNWTQTTNQTSNTAQLGSAEVIAEAPSDGTVLPLSNFGTVNFTNATADNQPIGNENASSLTMVSGANVTLATPSALTGGNAFTVTWDSTGSTAAPAGPAGTAPGGTAPGGTAPGQHHHHHQSGA